jgi:hypothetical protein
MPEEIQPMPEEIRPMPEEFQESEPVENEKVWSRPSWKDDRGYIGGSFGIFTPYRNYSTTAFDPRQNGFFLNATIGYLPSLLLGVSTTLYFYGAPKMDKLRMTLWNACGIMIGPLISLPIGNRIKWELRPQVGYFMISPTSSEAAPDSPDTRWTGLASNVSTGFRLNLGKRTCYMLSVEYLSATYTFDDPQGTSVTSPLKPRVISVNSASVPNKSLMSYVFPPEHSAISYVILTVLPTTSKSTFLIFWEKERCEVRHDVRININISLQGKQV